MLNMVAEALSAWNQTGFLLGAGMFAGLGALLVGNRIYWRMCTIRVSGTIIGVRETEKGVYHAAYRYSLPGGASIEATSDTGSSATSRLQTGRAVRLMVFEEHPQEATDADSYAMEIIGGILVAVAIALLYIALTAWPSTLATWVMLAGLVLYSVSRFLKPMVAPGQRPSAPAWRKARDEKLRAAPVRPVEEILSAPELIEQRRKQLKG
jgi:hypothetical protein